MNGYSLSRNWFDHSFENPERVKPNHTAIYFFAIEHCNRLGWKSKFGLPTTMVMEAVGIRSYNTYKKCLSDIVAWGFLNMIERSTNQYSSNIVALSNFDKASVKAYNKALSKHSTKHSIKQVRSTIQSNCSINKPKNLELLNLKTIEGIIDFLPEVIKFLSEKENAAQVSSKRPKSIEEVELFFFSKGANGISKQEAERFWNFYDSKGWKVGKTPMVKWKSAATNWIRGKVKDKSKDLTKQTYSL